MVASVMIIGGVVGAGVAGASTRQAASAQRDAATQSGAAIEDAQNNSRDILLAGSTQAHGIRNTGYNALEASNQTYIDKILAVQTQAATESRDILVDAVASGNQERIDAAGAAFQQRVKYAEQAMAMAGNGGGASAGAAIAQIQKLLDQSRTDLAPYMEAGKEANAKIVEGTRDSQADLIRRFSNEDFVKDPGYDFRLKEGMKTVQEGAGARGDFLSGGTLKALQQYGQGFASNEFDKAYQRYNTDQTNRFTRLSSLADRGSQASSTMVNANMTAAGQMSQAEMAAQVSNAQTAAQAASMRAGIWDGVGRTAYDNENMIGGFKADTKFQVGKIKAGTVHDIGQYTTDSLRDTAGNKGGGITARMNNDANYATDQAGIKSNSTLAIGNARAGVFTNVGNANAAEATAQGNIWGNLVNRATNSYTTMAALNSGYNYNPYGVAPVNPVRYAQPTNDQILTTIRTGTPTGAANPNPYPITGG